MNPPALFVIIFRQIVVYKNSAENICHRDNPDDYDHAFDKKRIKKHLFASYEWDFRDVNNPGSPGNTIFVITPNTRDNTRVTYGLITPLIPSAVLRGVKVQKKLTIHVTKRVISAAFVERFQAIPKTVIQNTGISHENIQFAPSTISGKKKDAQIASMPRIIIMIRIFFVCAASLSWLLVHRT
jgi:hypothetical protein